MPLMAKQDQTLERKKFVRPPMKSERFMFDSTEES